MESFQMQMTSLLTLIPRTSRHKKLLFQSNIKNMKMTHTRVFTSHPFEFSVSSVIDFVFSPAMCFPIGYPPSTIAAHIRRLFTPSSFIFSCVPPPRPNFQCVKLSEASDLISRTSSTFRNGGRETLPVPRVSHIPSCH